MEADDAVELGPDAPALELPWEDPEGRWNYVDLRGGAGRAGPDFERNLKRLIDRIPEGRQFPALRRLLLEVNSPPGAWQTAKCGVSAAAAAENPCHAAFAHSSYVDVVLAEEFATQRTELELHQRLAREMAGCLAAHEDVQAHAELVVRRCYFHRSASPEESDAGYCLTLFLTGYGESAAKASENLKSAMALAGECLLKSRPG